jgi:hypothetical protein
MPYIRICHAGGYINPRIKRSIVARDHGLLGVPK